MCMISCACVCISISAGTCHFKLTKYTYICILKHELYVYICTLWLYSVPCSLSLKGSLIGPVICWLFFSLSPPPSSSFSISISWYYFKVIKNFNRAIACACLGFFVRARARSRSLTWRKSSHHTVDIVVLSHFKWISFKAATAIVTPACVADCPNSQWIFLLLLFHLSVVCLLLLLILFVHLVKNRNEHGVGSSLRMSDFSCILSLSARGDY